MVGAVTRSALLIMLPFPVPWSCRPTPRLRTVGVVRLRPGIEHWTSATHRRGLAPMVGLR